MSLAEAIALRPTIVAGLGYSGGQAQLHTGTPARIASLAIRAISTDCLTPVPPYVPAAVLTVVVAVASDRLRARGPFILLCLPVSIAGPYL